ncbi:hypothetical protein TWF506_007816 [Arthrobotrys conoides]|uniref:Uncharacterized protein n=1 Tax=Arthrobotrys conoides TaxID=74498 RepID=A0AAN8NFF6_9PEZI
MQTKILRSKAKAKDKLLDNMDNVIPQRDRVVYGPLWLSLATPSCPSFTTTTTTTTTTTITPAKTARQFTPSPLRPRPL